MLQENISLQDDATLQGNNELPKPNLRKFTEEEESEILSKVAKLLINGHKEEALKLGEQLPMIPILAQDAKEHYGMEYVLKSGMNLSDTVEEYGEEWLEK